MVMPESAGLALMSASVTGFGSGRTGASGGVARVRKGLADHPGDPDDREPLLGVVVEDLVAQFHSLQVQGGGVVAHAVPNGLAVAPQVFEAVLVGLRFHEPMGHVVFPLDQRLTVQTDHGDARLATGARAETRDRCG